MSRTYAAGAVGAVANMFAAWLLAKTGAFALLGCRIAIEPTKEWIYSRLVWGGIFGLFFVLPILSNSVVKRGLLLGLLPAFFQLLVVFPILLHKTILGLDLGYTTPVFVIVLNLIWGLVAAGWLQMTG